MRTLMICICLFQTPTLFANRIDLAGGFYVAAASHKITIVERKANKSLSVDITELFQSSDGIKLRVVANYAQSQQNYVLLECFAPLAEGSSIGELGDADEISLFILKFDSSLDSISVSNFNPSTLFVGRVTA